MKALALLFRVVTGRCEGGKALTNAAIQFCAAVLLVGAPTAAYYVAPIVWGEYQGLKNSLTKIERTLEIREAREADQDRRIAGVERRQEDQSDRMDHLSDRVSRIEGSRDGRH